MNANEKNGAAGHDALPNMLGEIPAAGAGSAVHAEMFGDYMKAAAAVAKQPNIVIDHLVAYWTEQLKILDYAARKASGQSPQPVVKPAHDDRRFKDSEWNDNPAFDAIKQSYLSTVYYVSALLKDLNGIDDEARRRIEFNLIQLMHALAPTNFAFLNPEVIRTTLSSNGANLVKGVEHLMDDFVRGGGRVSPKLTDRSAFEVGRNLATTPGKVVHQNELMQLIQYEPATEKVRQRPVLIVPSWINKFYILDLSEKNSFIRWLVGEGYTVFVISWVNPDARHANKTFSDYMKLGPLAAIDIIAERTGEPLVNALGYCIGGTLLATTLAVLAARNDFRITSATFVTTLVDFSDPGDMAVFTSDAHLNDLQDEINRNGFLDARVMAETFSMLRANDLVWSAAIKSYFLGQEPPPFDILFWNADSTRMPGDLHMSFLRDMYRDNRLIRPGGITVDGIPVNLYNVRTSTYILSTSEDHIAPWKSTFAAMRIFGGDNTFVLAGSGHVGGVINSPISKKYGYWTNEQVKETPDEWLASAQQTAGSWWTHWQTWLAGHSGEFVPARHPDQVIETAPGSYVKIVS